jgi:hypothetical protein
MINGATKANDGCTTPCAGKTSYVPFFLSSNNSFIMYQGVLWWSQPSFGVHVHTKFPDSTGTLCKDHGIGGELGLPGMLGVRDSFSFDWHTLIQRDHRENGPGNLPYKMTWLNNNTVDACIAQCLYSPIILRTRLTRTNRSEIRSPGCRSGIRTRMLVWR